MTEPGESNSPRTVSGRWKREHPEAAREYARRSNAKRPERNRMSVLPCRSCGAPRKARGSATGLCRSCWLESIR